MKNFTIYSVILLLMSFIAPGIIAQEADSTARVYDASVSNPAFPGGNEAMISFIAKNVEYPVESREMGISGKLVIEAIVEKDGSLSNLKVLKSVYRDIDREGLRVLRMMPAWEPGKVDGRPVRSRIVIPIVFRMK